jgi:hypothetical protein
MPGRTRRWVVRICILFALAGAGVFGRSYYLRMRFDKNERAAIAALRAYAGAQNIFHRTDYDENGVLEYCGPANPEAPDFTYLYYTRVKDRNIGLIDEALADAQFGAKDARPYHGYLFADITEDDQGNPYNPAFSFGLCAVPVEYDKTGHHTYAIDIQGTIYVYDTQGKPCARFPSVGTFECNCHECRKWRESSWGRETM